MASYSPNSFHLQWHITESCNLQCKHCYQDPNYLSSDLPLDALQKILNDFEQQTIRWSLKKENVRISLTGGEPLIRKDFFKLLFLLFRKKNLFQYGVMTNGIFLDKENVRKLKNLEIDYAQISIEGLEKINDQIRGKGSFRRAIYGAKLLKEEGLKTSLSMTVTKKNINEVPGVVRLAKKLNARLGIRRCVHFGNSRGMEKSTLTPGKLRALWHYLHKVNQKSSSPLITLGCEDGILEQDIPEYHSSGCSAGYLSFTLMPDGDVYPCRRLPLFSGNLLKESFEDIYYNSETMKALRNYRNINDVCYRCDLFERCLGGAKCLSYSHFGDSTAPDPHCWKLFHSIPEPKQKWKNSSKSRPPRMNHRMINFTT